MWKPIVGLLALVLLLVGCASNSPSTPSAEAQLCQSLANLHVAANELTQVNGNTTVGEVKGYPQEVAAALAQVKKDAANVHDARVSDLNAAVDNLQHTINTLPNSMTLSEAAATIKAQAASVQSAQAQLGTQVNCGTPTATP